jgi:hypothetical protein
VEIHQVTARAKTTQIMARKCTITIMTTNTMTTNTMTTNTMTTAITMPSIRTTTTMVVEAMKAAVATAGAPEAARVLAPEAATATVTADMGTVM